MRHEMSCIIDSTVGTALVLREIILMVSQKSVFSTIKFCIGMSWSIMQCFYVVVIPKFVGQIYFGIIYNNQCMFSAEELLLSWFVSPSITGNCVLSFVFYDTWPVKICILWTLFGPGYVFDPCIKHKNTNT